MAFNVSVREKVHVSNDILDPAWPGATEPHSWIETKTTEWSRLEESHRCLLSFFGSLSVAILVKLSTEMLSADVLKALLWSFGIREHYMD